MSRARASGPRAPAARLGATLAWGVAAAVAAPPLAGSAALAAAPASRGAVTFTARQSEVALDGVFRGFDADVAIDPAHPQEGRVSVVIDLASVDAGGDDANRLLRSAEFFDVARHPRATFEATAIAPAAHGGFVATGPLTIKGQVQTATIAFTVRRDGPTIRLDGGTTISRLAFHVGEGPWADTGSLEDAVLIHFTLQLSS